MLRDHWHIARAARAGLAPLYSLRPRRTPLRGAHGRGARLDGLQLAREIVDALVDRQAADVVLLDLEGLSTFADYFVIASADSERQLRALADAVDAIAATNEGARRANRPLWEGRNEDGWRLADLGDTVVHLFSVEQRAYYNLEGLWRRAREVVHIQ